MKKWFIRIVVVLISLLIFEPILKYDCPPYYAGLHYSSRIESEKYLFINISGLSDAQIDDVLDFVSFQHPEIMFTIQHKHKMAFEINEIITSSLIICQDEPLKYRTKLFKDRLSSFDVDTTGIPQEAYFNFEQEGFAGIPVVTLDNFREFSYEGLVVVVGKMGNRGNFVVNEEEKSDSNYIIPSRGTDAFIYKTELFVLILNSFVTKEFISELPGGYHVVIFIVFSLILLMSASFLNKRINSLLLKYILFKIVQGIVWVILVSLLILIPLFSDFVSSMYSGVFVILFGEIYFWTEFFLNKKKRIQS